MSAIPKFTIYQSTKQEKERLEQWVHLYNLDNALTKAFDDETAEERNEIAEMQAEWNALSEFEQVSYRKKIANSVRNFDGKVSIGDIRLIPDDLLKSDAQPRYIAVLQEWDDGEVLIAPFSKFHIPAVQGEMKTNQEHFSLQNLELWNTMIVPLFSLQKSSY